MPHVRQFTVAAVVSIVEAFGGWNVSLSATGGQGGMTTPEEF